MKTLAESVRETINVLEDTNLNETVYDKLGGLNNYLTGGKYYMGSYYPTWGSSYSFIITPDPIAVSNNDDLIKQFLEITKNTMKATKPRAVKAMKNRFDVLKRHFASMEKKRFKGYKHNPKTGKMGRSYDTVTNWKEVYTIEDVQEYLNSYSNYTDTGRLFYVDSTGIVEL